MIHEYGHMATDEVFGMLYRFAFLGCYASSAKPVTDE